MTTLAAMLIFVESDIDIAIMEVGLGGRLDAVNIFDPEVSVNHLCINRSPRVFRRLY